jgi:hypothetical protein
MKTICLKLSSGEELIACKPESREILSESLACFEDLVLQDVHIINLTPVKEGMAISFIPWAMGAGRGTLTINRDHVTSLYDPDPDLEVGFLNQINKVQLVSAGPGIRM